MLSYIKNIPTLKNLFQPKKEILHLGRWSFIEDAKLYRRADMSNEDHCGPCGSYILEKQKEDMTRHAVRTKMDDSQLKTKPFRVNIRTQFKDL